MVVGPIQLQLQGASAKNCCTLRVELDTSPLCLDVVFITDGKRNDPSLDVCKEVRCLHTATASCQLGVNVHAIGINSGSGFQPTNIQELE